MTEIDGDDLEACIESGTKTKAFEQTQGFLNRVRETYDIQCIYIVKPLNTDASDNMMNVMAGITAREIEEDEAFYSVELGETTGTDYSPAVAAKYLSGMDADGITFFRNATEYGDDYTGQIRTCNSAGNPIAMLAADVSIDELRGTFQKFVLVMGVEIVIYAQASSIISRKLTSNKAVVDATGALKFPINIIYHRLDYRT